MEVTTRYTVNASPERVLDALMSRELLAARLAPFKIQDFTFTQNGPDSATATIPVSTDAIPAAARRFIRDGSEATIEFRRTEGMVSAHASAPGIPGSAEVICTVSGEASAEVIETGNVKVTIPLLGKTIEKNAAAPLRAGLENDASLLAALVANGSSRDDAAGEEPRS